MQLATTASTESEDSEQREVLTDSATTISVEGKRKHDQPCDRAMRGIGSQEAARKRASQENQSVELRESPTGRAMRVIGSQETARK